MRALVLVAALSLPAHADPLALIDLTSLAPAGGVAGAVTLPDGTILYPDADGGPARCDPARGPNLADMVIELQMAQTVLMACPGLSSDTRQARVAALSELVLPRYAERAGTSTDAATAAFLARARDEVPLVTRCGVVPNDLVADAVDPWFETRLREAMVSDRPPARSCPRDLQ